VALWLTFNLRDHLKEFDWKKIGSALTMGAAISAMH
jgi:NO-binding membrane sensor protein with MHYT domain